MLVDAHNMTSNPFTTIFASAAILLSSSSLAADLIAPSHYARVVPRLQLPVGDLYQNLYYEGNNIELRGPRTSTGLYIDSGPKVADRWRQAAERCRAIFVLRDSLYCQQDHPFRQTPYAPMLPPNWVTTAAHLAYWEQPIRPLAVFNVYDDAGWTSLLRPTDLFGSFPVSNALFKRATAQNNGSSPSKQREIYNARTTLILMAKDTRFLIEAAPRGAVAVAQVGAERISYSDCKYFGSEIRRNHVIPIFVENPTPHERNEGKGTLPQNHTVIPEIASMTTQVIYRRRLQDGDLAIERYDLSQRKERARAINVLESIVPKSDERRTLVWLWVTGPLNNKGELTGQDATRWIDQFRSELAESNANGGRIVLFSKPSIELPLGSFRQASFDAYLQEFEQLAMPMSVNLSTKSITPLFEPLVTALAVD